MPCSGGIGFLIMVRLQYQIAGGEKDAFDFGVLADFRPGDFDDEFVMFSRNGRAIFHPPAFKGDPVDAHLGHVRVGKIASAFRGETGELCDLIAREFPFQPGKFGARIVRTFRIFHHLPEAFDAGVTLAMENKGRGREVGENAQFVALGKDDFARFGFLRENLPRRRAIGRDGLPPFGRVMVMGCDLGR